MPFVIVESDFVRRVLTQGKPTYAADESAYIHLIARTVIGRLLIEGNRVIHDATNLAEWHREQMYRLARRAHSRLLVVRTIAPEAVVRERLAKRHRERDPLDLSDADWSVYELLKTELESVRRPHLVVDTSADIDEAVRQVLQAMR